MGAAVGAGDLVDLGALEALDLRPGALVLLPGALVLLPGALVLLPGALVPRLPLL